MVIHEDCLGIFQELEIIPQEYTTLIAQRMARHLGWDPGYLAWCRFAALRSFRGSGALHSVHLRSVSRVSV